MILDIQSQGFTISPELRRRIERRLRFALHHNSGRITRVTMRLADINGPKGGPDKLCRVTLNAGRLKDIVVEDVQTDLQTAIHRTVDRLKHTLERKVAQERRQMLRNRGLGLRVAGALPSG